MKGRESFALLVAGLAPLLLSACQTTFKPPQRIAADYLIEDGLVYDGSGTAPRIADIAVRSDRIVFIGDATDDQFADAKRIDASGLIVAPGLSTRTPMPTTSWLRPIPSNARTRPSPFRGSRPC
ncbi:hypothetical protein [Sphingopyxis sp. BSNA05]|uniref:hypothetical protein n=1 Tax=Sphingopyxis sp. BSNA05 TaxID=1236614 RepID=UPI0020B8CABA|nr:hypothetical protein [Sphingopyxis sp. BSNA05]